MGPPPRPVTTPPLVWDMPVLLLPLQLDTLDTDTVVWDMPLLQLLMVLSPLPSHRCCPSHCCCPSHRCCPSCRICRRWSCRPRIPWLRSCFPIRLCWTSLPSC